MPGRLNPTGATVESQAYCCVQRSLAGREIVDKPEKETTKARN